MPYGTVKVDNITFDNGGADQNVTVSGIHRAITSGVTVTGTISGAVLIGTTTVSGATVTGTTVQGTTIQGVSGTFTSLTGTTTTGTTANFVSGVFTTRVSGTTVTGNTGQFTSGTFVSLTGTTITGTTVNAVTVSSTTGTFGSITGTTITGTTINGATVNATTGNFTSLTGVTVTGTTARFTSGTFTTQVSGLTVTGTQSSFTSGNFITLSGATATFTSGVIASGTATNPSLSIVGDGNTGIYSPGADQLAVATNGVGRLFIRSDGKTTLISSTSLEVSNLTGTANKSSRIVSSHYDATEEPLGLIGANHTISQSSVYIGGGFSAVNTASDIRFFTDTDTTTLTGTERLRITSAGLVGIGTSAPGAALHTNSSGQLTANLDTSANVNQIISDTSANAGAGGSLVFACNNGSSRFAAIKGITVSTATNSRGDLAFSTRTAVTDATLTEKLRITSAGNVGIGTTNPASPLQVNGDVAIGDKIIHIGDTDTAIRFPTGNTFTVETGGSERLRVDNNYMRMASGTSGLQFGGDTAAANALNDYEEGTWTSPAIVGTTVAGTGTYSVQIGRYTKIGERVYFMARFIWSAHTGTGNIRISGLPFTSSAAAGTRHAVSIYHSNLTSPAGTVIQAYVPANSSQIVFESIATGGGTSAVLAMDTAAEIMVTGHYEV